MHFKLIVQLKIKSIMIIKFNIGVFVFTEKIQVIKLGHHTGVMTEIKWFPSHFNNLFFRL